MRIISNKKRDYHLVLIKVVLPFFIMLQFNALFAQDKPKKPSKLSRDLGLVDSNDSLNTKKLPKISEYQIISNTNDTTYVDTTLTIQKEYKFNYLRKDNFGLMPFSNLGQTYNSLTHNFQNTNLMPNFGARARHFNYMEIEDT